MKYTFTRNTTFALMSAILLLAACAKETDTQKADKKVLDKIEKLKADRTKINAEIDKLELQLSSDVDKTKYKVVAVQAVQTRAFDYYVQTQGSVYSKNNILVSAKSPGVITDVYVTEGDQVVEGKVLAQIDNKLLLRNIEELKSGLELAKTVYQKQKNLWDQKIGTEVQYLQAKNNKENLEKRLATLNEQIEMTRIKSPIEGTIDEVRLRVGENIAPGVPAIRVVSAKNLRVKASFSESFVSTIRKGNKVVVNFPSLNRSLEAKVSFIGRTIDPLSRTFEVEVELPSQADLRPNMTAIIKVVYDSYPTALTVPVNVVQAINNERVIYVAETTSGKSVARRKVIKIAGVFDNLVQVTEGLQVGDRVITTGYQGLNDGDPIKL